MAKVKTEKEKREVAIERAAAALLKAAEIYYTDWHKLLWRSFVNGLVGALGATVGLAIVLSLLGALLSHLGVLPVIGNFFSHANELLNSYVSH